MIAAVVSVALSTVLSMPISAIIAIVRTGAFSDFSGWVKTIQADPQAAKEMMNNLSEGPLTGTMWSIVDMLFSAALLEEGLKFLTCRIAIRKKDMVRTWMDSVVAFAFVGITFEMIENVAFGGAEILNVILRACAPVHTSCLA
ncbi:MAG: PrsW family intramembrane metalloprotease [Oscillospiraceae bacterium]|nr:PrsW family intramembrane metalloprotease [Oscillospiraceae bacterium]